MTVTKPRLAVWKFSSCDGCQLTLLDCEDELLAVAGEVEIAYFLEASRATNPGPYDLSLVEGSITTADDIERIHEVRRLSGHVVSIGACATAGGIQALRNFADVREFTSVVYARPDYIHTLATSTPPSAHIAVDFELHGCPIDKRQLLEVITAFLRGRRPQIASHSVCFECKRRGTVCVMVAKGIPCLGPVTHAGCGAICPAYNRGCYGCFGPADVTNIPALVPALAAAGMSPFQLTRVFRTFNAEAPAFREASTGAEIAESHPVTHTNGASRTLSVGSLARVEGEGSMHVVVRDGVVSDVELRIFEPPRFFEAFLRGRAAAEVPDIAARICGICPVAYQMSACQAIESACGIAVDDQVRALRRLLYCGEWIESHALHIYLLHAPDFLGYESSVALAQDHRAIVERGLQLKKVGNDILNVLGGRAIHPVNVRVGGFYKAPSFAELDALTERLRWAVDAAIETVQWVAGFDFPDLQLEGDLVAMQHEHEYPITEGRIASTSGLDIPVDDFPEHFSEEQVAHSTALHGRMRGGGTYTVGPLARYNLNYDRLPALVKELAVAAGVARECRNPFQSIIVRALEVVFACDEALRIIAAYTPPAAPSAEMPARGGTGHGCTEAPRGLLYHRYTVDDAGVIRDAVIVPPTSQNQPSIERGLREFVQVRLDLDDAELTRQCEQAIRNYDPCISCATHFLDLTVDRG